MDGSAPRNDGAQAKREAHDGSRAPPPPAHLHASVKLTAEGVAHVTFEGAYRNLSGRWLFLLWWGDFVGSVTVSASAGKPKVRRKGGRAVLGVWVDGPDISIEIDYAVRLAAAQVAGDRLLVFSRKNLPGVSVTPEPTDGPEAAIDWAVEDEHVQTLGTLYSHQDANEQGAGVSRFLLYSGTPFGIYAGRLVPLFSDQEVTVSALEQVGKRADLTFGGQEFSKTAAAVRQHYGGLLGEAFVKHRSVVVFDVPRGTSRSLGSSILVNLAGIGWPPLTDEGKVGALYTIAHEYAHSWLYYGVRWLRGAMTGRLNEALALPVALDAVERIGGPSWHRVVLEKDLWGRIADALTRPMPSLGPGVPAVSAGLVLEALRQQHRDAFFSCLRELRERGRLVPLSLEVVADALDHRIPMAGSALKNALERPRPLVLRTRKVYSTLEPEAPWTYVVRGSRRATTMLQQRLTFSRLGLSTTRSEKHVSWSGAGSEELSTLIRSLEPWYFVSRRRQRHMWIKDRPFLRRLWNWAVRTCHSGAEIRNLGTAGSVRLAIATALAMLLNPDDLAAYLGAAKLTAPWSKRVARLLALRGVARSGERVVADAPP